MTFTHPKLDADALQAALAESRINSSVSRREYAVYDFEEKAVDACLRLSPHYYNSDEEVETVAEAVSAVA